MKKILKWALFLLLCWNGWTQDLENYLKKFASIAVQEMERTGIPASIKLGQGILESSYGNSLLAREANNHFGIKCGKDWSGSTFDHNDDRQGECFRKYDTPWHSFLDHSKFLKKPRYSGLFSLSRDGYKAWAKELKRAGYATAVDYAERLISRIEEHQLWRFDKTNSQGLEVRLDSIFSDMGLTKSMNIAMGNLSTGKSPPSNESDPNLEKSP